MLRIGKAYKDRRDGFTRMCSRIRIGEKEQELWFGVPAEQESALSFGRADPFVLALLPAAMREGLDVVAEDPMSERLHLQLRNDLIPVLDRAGDLYHPVTILAPLENRPLPCEHAVATGFSGGVDSLYTVLRHGKDCEYPLTHLAVFNSGVFEGKDYRKGFRDACDRCALFAREMGLETVFVDSNLPEVLPERYLDVVTLRLLSCALAVQGLVSVYLHSSALPVETFAVKEHEIDEMEPLTVNCVCTETLRVYLSGSETDRWRKLEALSAWEPSYRWLSPCIFGKAGKQNCGHCKKCLRDLAALYALDRLDVYRPVFDVEDYRRHLPERLGIVLADQSDPFCRDDAALLRERNAKIPPLAWKCAELFRRAMEKNGGEKDD